MAEEQVPLFSEDMHEALRALIAALGGAKKVAAQMRPDLPADDAGRWLSKCLDSDRPEKLSLTQLLWLLRAGHDAGCHVAMQFLAAEAGYSATPIEPVDERAALERQFVSSVRALRHIESRMERLAGLSGGVTPLRQA